MVVTKIVDKHCEKTLFDSNQDNYTQIDNEVHILHKKMS